MKGTLLCAKPLIYDSILDKSHIEDLIKEIDILSSKSYGDYHLTHVIDTWIQLYSTLADSLCAKHGWNKTTMKVSVSSEVYNSK